MIFDKEMWRIVPSDVVEEYAVVLPNVVRVYPLDGEEYLVPIVVPSELFEYLLSHGVTVADMGAKSVYMFLEVGNAYCIFGVAVAEAERLDKVFDLWNTGHLPVWANRDRAVS